MGTLRQDLIALLRETPMDLCDIAAALGLREREAADHLAHAARTIKSQGGDLQITPAYCRQCDFEFRKHGRFTRPGRCPQCRSNRVQGAIYFIQAQRK